MTTRQLRAEVERLRGEVSGYREHVSQMADVQMYDRNLIKTLSAEIERLRSDTDTLWSSIAEKNKEILRLRNAIKRIDGINDNPADFNAAIDEVCNTILRPGSAPQQPMTGVSRSS